MAGSMPNLPAVLVDRQRRTGCPPRNLGSEIFGGEERLERIPIQLQADQLPLWTLLHDAEQRLAADERAFIKVHGPAQADIVWGRFLILRQCLAGRYVIDLYQEQT